MAGKTGMYSLRLSPELNARLSRACDGSRNTMAPTRAQLVTHGIELALAELEPKRNTGRSPGPVKTQPQGRREQ